jgi:murein DD-endopeptidase MepM/ murein hydrolase activator NlpD/GH25 family lysozyme M1 (1,4-beta-N-acetylmuramidase)
MGNEYNADGKIILRDTSGNQMSLPRFFQLALVGEGGEYARPTSYYHTNAWDMGAPENKVPARTPVFGTVVKAEQTGYNDSMGTCVIIDEGNGRTHCFFHMVANSLVVSVGDTVSQGDKLGMIGNTGESYGAHLHYDVREGGSRIGDPMLAYDCATLPAGWNFGDAVANGNNWDYIPLDKTATDYGPPGGETPSEPFFPQTECYDISWAQVVNGSLNTCIDAIANSGGGGVIIQVGAIRNSGFEAATSFNPAEAVQRTLDAGLGLGIYFYNYANYENDMTQAFEDALAYLQTIGATKDKVNMGVWIDTEQGSSWDPTPSSDANTNYAFVERFMNVFDDADYPLVGVYSSAGTFTIYPASSIGDKPIWAAYIDFSFESATRATLEQYLPESTYTKVYIFQHSWVGRVPGYNGDLDCDKVLMALPTSGGGGGGGGGEYTEVIKVTVDVIPPKRIYFSPVPGIIPTLDTRLDEREQQITITTDADNASLYYTLDGSSPYQYTTNNGTTAYTVAANALLYSSSITINKDTHIRVIAVPSGTSPGMTFDEPLAKGSGTFLFQYRNVAQTWEEEQKSYATSDGAVSFFEENKQAFLRLHAEQTDEEILYTEVYRHDTQVAESDASDSASKTEEGGQPTYDGSDEPTDTTEEEGDADVSDE